MLIFVYKHLTLLQDNELHNKSEATSPNAFLVLCSLYKGTFHEYYITEGLDVTKLYAVNRYI